MRLLTRVWAAFTVAADWFGLSPFDNYGTPQQPIGGISRVSHGDGNTLSRPPFFEPPGSNIQGFKCDYSNMGSDWKDCSDGSEFPGCWLINKKENLNFSIYTDYEQYAPIGVPRNYVLNVTDGQFLNVDGINFTDAKLFNNSFPGPLIEACWGDTVSITVINFSKYNGTSIHWHGIRQNQTMHMDGVNGVTQCPIAPNDEFTYTWNVTQYGSSWYHSHYSVQYADGLQGPITLHGPTSENYDEAITPLITSDWLHTSAFGALYAPSPKAAQKDTNGTILLNGRGNCTQFYNQSVSVCDPETIPEPFTMVWNETAPNPNTGARRYLVRIINTSFSTEITFSIDNHYLTVVEADFVPTFGKTVNTVLVAIGQRYHVIVEAKPYPDVNGYIPADGNFWIRTNSSACFDDFEGTADGFEKTGILRYNSSSTSQPNSTAWPGNMGQCQDTLTTSLQTVYNWTVTAPKNDIKADSFAANFNNSDPNYAVAKFAFQRKDPSGFIPFQTDYGNPTFLNLDNIDVINPGQQDWPIGWVVVPENYTADDFVYLLLVGQQHPIHLHGHDFAVLDYQANATWNGELNFPYQNRMRRDVILLPSAGGNSGDGYVLIAFKTDNPGAWLMHCHIAFHASTGLALQIMERQSAANDIWPPGKSPALSRAHRLCANWNSWSYDCKNFWPGNLTDANNEPYWPACDNATMLQNDSGI